MQKHISIPCVITVVVALIYTWDSKRSGNLDSIKPQLFLYSPLCFLMLETYWLWLKRFSVLVSLSVFVSRYSMTIYFSHIFFLRLLRKIDFFNQNSLTMLLTFLVVVASSTFIGFIPESLKYLIKKLGFTNTAKQHE